MDFPLFHLDWLNDRFLIAFIAIIHVLINHGLAVGFIPYITWLEQTGVRKAAPDQITDPAWDEMVYKKMKVAFMITTTLGAMTGVGIWFSAALISPASIGSLIRVFYFAWFVEWTVFVTEVVLILIYFLTWKNANQSLVSKLRHIRFGWFLSLFSWITMAIIVSILGFMMDPGNWNNDHSLLNGFTNPIYLPQLLFRTPAAMILGGVFGMLLTTVFTDRGTAIRKRALKMAAVWILSWMPVCITAAVLYYRVMPAAMKANMSTAVGTMEFAQYYDLLKYVIIGALGLVVVVSVWALIKPAKLRFIVVLIPCIAAFGFLGLFERVREFIRKPYVIGGYMYSNLLREEDYPLYQRDGILKHAIYTAAPEVTATNKLTAGREVFLLSCSRCHTTHGINSVVTVFERMFGAGKPLDEASMIGYIPNMHMGRTYMPPFPGNKAELEALAAYIRYLQQTGETLEGAQAAGVTVSPLQNTMALPARINEDTTTVAGTITPQ
ncbi:c-type cytochrome [Chitinophaga nivalis]|uniref:Cytochrome c n=1 Tax=Chitinophaga nivalis TaxID=2991709 RepID=A0ABT3IIF1_9BACT|nr:cytochrome c [Chitinophaga nivalis]MCW3466729.1 cytochrome c [Chitinophaga nivalis]MCW3483580.1 cytochrome c [Chitinophaga nivalis]